LHGTLAYSPGWYPRDIPVVQPGEVRRLESSPDPFFETESYLIDPRLVAKKLYDVVPKGFGWISIRDLANILNRRVILAGIGFLLALCPLLERLVALGTPRVDGGSLMVK